MSTSLESYRLSYSSDPFHDRVDFDPTLVLSKYHRHVSNCCQHNDTCSSYIPQDVSTKLIIVMVGLPARGKSYITKKLCRYLNWLQHETKIFNVGDRRRKLALDPIAKTTSDIGDYSAAFFDPGNQDASKMRETAAMGTLDELLDCLLFSSLSVALFDATNTTRPRRELIMKRVAQRIGTDLPVLFLESQCFDHKLLDSNMGLKLSGPDYQNRDPVKALKDFKSRIEMYEKRYEPLGDIEEAKGYSFCQMIDVGRKFILHNINGYLAHQAVQYLQHFHLKPRQIWLTRHGQSYDDLVGRLGGNAHLTMRGERYAEALTKLMDKQRSRFAAEQSTQMDALGPKTFQVWTSNTLRSIQTAQYFDRSTYVIKHLKMLDELNAGLLDGLTREEIREFHSDWLEGRQQDKFRHRYPGLIGEGYHDVTARLKSVILEIETVTDHILLISGLAVTRILLAYFRGLKRDETVNLSIPTGTLYMLEPKPYGVESREFVWDPINCDFSESVTAGG